MKATKQVMASSVSGIDVLAPSWARQWFIERLVDDP